MLKINPLIMKNMVDMFHPIGEYYETSNLEFDPNKLWGGTWELEEDGTTLVSKSSTSGSAFNKDIGTIVGEEKHTLTVDELASHSHNTRHDTTGGGSNQFTCKASVAVSNSYNTQVKTESVGGNQPHNNVQPSKIVNRWHRIA
jgi:hypothetical protein